jgi:pimeloyl-ACP methyl ester carboxylesterase
VPPADAERIVAELAATEGFLPTLLATHSAQFSGGRGINVPVTIVFGGLERVVPRGARRREELPRHTVWPNPPDLGHVPMWDDPAAVAEMLLEASS